MRFQNTVSFGMKWLLAVFAVVTLIKGEYVWAIGIVLAILITFMPTILARDFDVTLPFVFDIAITVSVFLHVVGGYVDWYDYVQYYDHFTHSISSATVALIAVTMLYVLAYYTELVKLPPAMFGLFTVMFTMTMGVVWEFLEWGFDMAFATTLQRGLTDTMLDLLFDTIAGLIVAVIAVVRLEVGEVDARPLVKLGDVQNSVGFKRWELLKEGEIMEALEESFNDPVVLEAIVDYVVKESKHFTDGHRKLWKRLRMEEI